MFHAMVVFYLLTSPAPIQYEALTTQKTLSECYTHASKIISDLTKEMKVISAQGFCIDLEALKKKEKMQNKTSKKEESRDPAI